MRRRTVGAAVGGCLVALLLVAGCGGSTSAARPQKVVVTGLERPQAIQLVHTYMEKEWGGQATWNTAVQDTLEVAPQVLIDDFAWKFDKSANFAAPKPPAHLSTQPVTVMVPEHASVFEAMTHGVYMIFVKSGGSWMQVYSPEVAKGAPPITPQVNAAGYAVLLPPSGYTHLKLAPNTIASRYAVDLADASEGAPATDAATFAPGPFTTELWASLKPGQHQTVASGAVPAAYATYAFRLKGGGAVIFFAVEGHVTYTASSGYHFTIAANSGYSGFVAPGSYSTEAATTLFNVAVIDPPSGSSAPIQVIGLSWGDIAFVSH